MTARIEIDPNIRVRGNQTFSGFEDADAPVSTGDQVLAWFGDPGYPRIVTDAVVADIDEERQLIYLSVEWASCREA